MRHHEDMSTTTYDAIPYRSLPLPHTHPSRLAALAHLFGVAPANPEAARVLEIGCGSGTNLLSIATSLPAARMVGFDLSGVQVAMAQRMAGETATVNVRFLHLDLAHASRELGEFDYIIAHGVFSWVPAQLQSKLLALCGDLLAPGGIAYVSYNTLPGWHMRGAARDLMRYHALEFGDPAEQVRQARGIVEFLAAHATSGGEAYRTELAMIQAQPDYYILHEQLEGDNVPLYFHEFVARARASGLQYLCETELHSMMPDAYPPQVADILQRISTDTVRQEQFMDFLRNRMFRQTLLVREGVRVDRKLPPARAEGLWFSGQVQGAVEHDSASGQPEEFTAQSGARVATANPVTRAALRCIGDSYPRSVAFADLLGEACARATAAASPTLSDREAGVLAVDLLRCVLLGLIEPLYRPLPCAARAGDRPATTPLARAQARGDELIATLRHECVDLDRDARAVLCLLDGSRDRSTLLGAVPSIGSAPVLDALLDRFARAGLLLA